MRANPLRLKFLVRYTKDTIYPKETKVSYDTNDWYLPFINKIQGISGHELCHHNYSRMESLRWKTISVWLSSIKNNRL